MPRPAPHDTRPPAHPLLLQLAAIFWLTLPAVAVSAGEGIAAEATLPYASPVAVACSADGRWLATASTRLDLPLTTMPTLASIPHRSSASPGRPAGSTMAGPDPLRIFSPAIMDRNTSAGTTR